MEETLCARRLTRWILTERSADLINFRQKEGEGLPMKNPLQNPVQIVRHDCMEPMGARGWVYTVASRFELALFRPPLHTLGLLGSVAELHPFSKRRQMLSVSSG